MTTYKIKKEFTPMDFYDYVKSQGREKCEEFRKDFDYWITHTGPFIKYSVCSPDSISTFGGMLSERTNFRRYMIEGGFVEEEKPKLEFRVNESTDYLTIYCGAKGILTVHKDGSGMTIYRSAQVSGLQTDSEGRIKIL